MARPLSIDVRTLVSLLVSLANKLPDSFAAVSKLEIQEEQMKTIHPILCAAVLIMTISSTVLAGTIVGARASRTGTIVGARGGTIVGARTGNIAGTRTGNIAGTYAITGRNDGKFRRGFNFVLSDNIGSILRLLMESTLF